MKLTKDELRITALAVAWSKQRFYDSAETKEESMALARALTNFQDKLIVAAADERRSWKTSSNELKNVIKRIIKKWENRK